LSALAGQAARAADTPKIPETHASELARPAPLRELLSDPSRLATWLVERNPDLAAARARITEADAALDQARVFPNPNLAFGVNDIPIGSLAPPAEHASDVLAYSVGATELFEIAKRGPRAEAARRRLNATRADARSVLSERLSDARDAIARVVYLNERRRLIDERLRSARHVTELEHVRLEHGDISGIDYDRLELEAEAIAREFADDEVELSAALADCSAVLLGSCQPIDAGMDVVDGAVPVPEHFPDVEALVRTRPDVLSERLASDASRSDAVYYRRFAIPDPTFGLTYTRDYYVASGSQPHTLGATVSLPLPLFDHGQHLARQAENEATEHALGARALEVRALADVRSLLFRRDVLRRKLDTLAKESIPRSNGVLASSEEAYHRGQLSLTDLLLVRREHASLLLDALDTRYALFSVRSGLHRALGLGVRAGPIER
jgi:cobalt-zinc-cadmium efflux system outer membrane protein